MVIAEVSITPISEGTSVSKFVRVAFQKLKDSGLPVMLTPMGTIIEADDIGELLRVVEEAHRAVVEMGARRVVTHIKIDDRRDKKVHMEDKVRSVLGQKMESL